MPALFYALFLPDRLYSPIWSGNLPNKAGSKIKLPLNTVYETPYEFDIIVPFSGDLNIAKNTGGRLLFRITRLGETLKKDVVEERSYGYMPRGVDTRISIYTFELPVQNYRDQLVLEIEVLKPFDKFQELKTLECLVSSGYRL